MKKEIIKKTIESCYEFINKIQRLSIPTVSMRDVLDADGSFTAADGTYDYYWIGTQHGKEVKVKRTEPTYLSLKSLLETFFITQYNISPALAEETVIKMFNDAAEYISLEEQKKKNHEDVLG